MDGYKSKTLATWVALVGGGIGLHRFYLHGLRDAWGWLWPFPTAIGAYGLRRAMVLGQGDHLAWALMPLLGLSLSAGAAAALIYGLMPDEKWNARFNPQGPLHESSWVTVFGIVLALLVGTAVLMSTIAFSAQRYFEYQMDMATPAWPLSWPRAGTEPGLGRALKQTTTGSANRKFPPQRRKLGW